MLTSINMSYNNANDDAVAHNRAGADADPDGCGGVALATLMVMQW